jgi:hypothetical protein
VLEQHFSERVAVEWPIVAVCSRFDCGGYRNHIKLVGIAKLIKEAGVERTRAVTYCVF